MLGTLVETQVTQHERASHAEQHMRNERIFGHVTQDDHLYGEWGKRVEGHSMFASPEDSILAITAALNTEAGADALGHLLGRPGGINLYSRTAAALITSASERRNDEQRFHDFQVDYVVVTLMDAARPLGPTLKKEAPGKLVIATAYPVPTGGGAGVADKDWWCFNAGAGGKLPNSFAPEPKPIAPWDV
ncbi:hypothetical protein [Corallococcus sp. 4LFB]|uniref:hypothetical protein n=1 Tax=Corallococcus sp. 4LFB TaxID=3383249 RepID=UPI00397649B9